MDVNRKIIKSKFLDLKSVTLFTASFSHCISGGRVLSFPQSIYSKRESWNQLLSKLIDGGFQVMWRSFDRC